MSERNYRVRALLHHDDGWDHPKLGRLVGQARRLSYHRTFDLAKARFDEIASENGAARAGTTTRVVFVEIDVRYIAPKGQPRLWSNLRRFRGMWTGGGEMTGATVAVGEAAT